MGGRGASSAGRMSGANGLPITAYNISGDIISSRETKREIVDQTLSTLKDVADGYSIITDDAFLFEITNKRYAGVLGISNGDSIGVNTAYFNDGMDKAMKESAKDGFHPKLGNKTGIQAVVAHEMGHVINQQIANKLGLSMNDTATKIVNEAKKNINEKGVVIMARKISQYATSSNAEAIAEAVSDVYCNGNKASKSSTAIVKVLKDYLK